MHSTVCEMGISSTVAFQASQGADFRADRDNHMDTSLEVFRSAQGGGDEEAPAERGWL